MNSDLTEMAGAAVARYQLFITNLRGLTDAAFRDGANNASVRASTLAACRGSARVYLQAEEANIERDSNLIAAGVTQEGSIDLTVATYVGEATSHLIDMLAAQVQRDVAAADRHIQTLGLRTDIYTRSGRYSLASATAKIASEEAQQLPFNFVDRLGRQYKSTKHIRDIYRLHLLNVRNEVFLYTAAEDGENVVSVEHPDASYRWQGQDLMIVDDGRSSTPLFYDLRAEIFHPGSEAYLVRRVSDVQA